MSGFVFNVDHWEHPWRTLLPVATHAYKETLVFPTDLTKKELWQDQLGKLNSILAAMNRASNQFDQALQQNKTKAETWQGHISKQKESLAFWSKRDRDLENQAQTSAEKRNDLGQLYTVGYVRITSLILSLLVLLRTIQQTSSSFSSS